MSFVRAFTSYTELVRNTRKPAKSPLLVLLSHTQCSLYLNAAFGIHNGFLMNEIVSLVYLI
jgi:hypothetical protein